MLYRAAGKSTRFLEKVEDHWKDTLVKDITPGAIQQAAIDLYPKALAATRNRQAIAPTVAIINHAAESDLCRHIRVRRFRIDAKVKEPVDLPWVETFMAHASPRMGAMALFMFLTGARISEAVAVRWADVDFKLRRVLIRQTKQRNERYAHMPQPLVVALANLPKDELPVFGYYNRGGGTVVAWARVCKRAGLPHRSFHCCRHGFATELLRKGVDVVTVAKLGGWKSAKLVLETYGHAMNDPTLTDLISGTPLTQQNEPSAAKPIRIGKSRNQ
jgi:integrase